MKIPRRQALSEARGYLNAIEVTVDALDKEAKTWQDLANLAKRMQKQIEKRIA